MFSEYPLAPVGGEGQGEGENQNDNEKVKGGS